MKTVMMQLIAPAIIFIASCNAANPPKQRDKLPNDSAAGMTNTTDHGSGTTMNDSLNGTVDTPPNKSILATDTSLNDTRSHLRDTTRR